MGDLLPLLPVCHLEWPHYQPGSARYQLQPKKWHEGAVMHKDIQGAILSCAGTSFGVLLAPAEALASLMGSSNLHLLYRNWDHTAWVQRLGCSLMAMSQPYHPPEAGTPPCLSPLLNSFCPPDLPLPRTALVPAELGSHMGNAAWHSLGPMLLLESAQGHQCQAGGASWEPRVGASAIGWGQPKGTQRIAPPMEGST